MALFRQQALEHNKVKLHGKILVTQPLSIWFLTIVSVVIVALMLLFLIKGNYTTKQRVYGVLVPDKGLVKVFANQPGVVSELLVAEGSKVEKGQILYRLNNENLLQSGTSIQYSTEQHLMTTDQSFADQELRMVSLFKSAQEAQKQQLNDLNFELVQVNEHIELVKQQIELIQKDLLRLKELAEQGFVGENQLDYQCQNRLNQQSTLLQVGREKIALERNIKSLQQQMTTSLFNHQNDLATLSRSRLATAQTRVENQIEQSSQIVAPVSGIVSAITVQSGQRVGSAPLLTILPEDSKLQAELYAPSQAISFIHTGREVNLRYSAFPYQKFGQHHGEVAHVSRVAMSAAEVTAMNLSNLGATQLYRITVDIEHQSVMVYQQEQPLQAGMDVEADILLDSRYLYEWLFEPLYGLYGRS